MGKTVPPSVPILSDPSGRPTHALIPFETYQALRNEIDSHVTRGVQTPRTKGDPIYSLSPAEFGARARAARKHCGLTQKALALKMEVTQSWISYVEKGRIDLGLKSMKKFCLYLGKENFH